MEESLCINPEDIPGTPDKPRKPAGKGAWWKSRVCTWRESLFVPSGWEARSGVGVGVGLGTLQGGELLIDTGM